VARRRRWQGQRGRGLVRAADRRLDRLRRAGLRAAEPDGLRAAAERRADAREFFTWALENGQQQAAALDYVPLPPELVAQIEEYWAAEFVGSEAPAAQPAQ
jgi:hypothetical protein